jgi:hypothetical protein
MIVDRMQKDYSIVIADVYRVYNKNDCHGVRWRMKKSILTMLNLLLLSSLISCAKVAKDQAGPVIQDMQSSGSVLVISDCPQTSVRITAQVTDPSVVQEVTLLYRIAPDQKFTSLPMQFKDNVYAASLEGANFLGHAYGTVDFYIRAKDAVGNTSQSEIDDSIQFLPCVSS